MTPYLRRTALPRVTDRYLLGPANAGVSPVCLGMTGSPETVEAAFEAGINFFFLTMDLHWPLYEANRVGLKNLLAKSPSIRDQIVVAAVSYLDEPLFRACQAHEVIASVPGLQRIDVFVAGGVPTESSWWARRDAMEFVRNRRQHGVTATGATFHSRRCALIANAWDALDVSFVRYNALHPGARVDLFPFVRRNRAPLYSFKSTMSFFSRETADGCGFPRGTYLPPITDSYRFAMTPIQVDGLLCSPDTPEHVRELVDALAKGPLSPEEEMHMLQLAGLAQQRAYAQAG